MAASAAKTWPEAIAAGRFWPHLWIAIARHRGASWDLNEYKFTLPMTSSLWDDTHLGDLYWSCVCAQHDPERSRQLLMEYCRTRELTQEMRDLLVQGERMAALCVLEGA